MYQSHRCTSQSTNRSALAWSVLLSTTIRVIIVVKFVVDSLGCASWVHNILTTMMTRIVLDKSTDHAIPHFDLFFTTISTSKKMYFQSASWKRHCMTHWREQRCLDSYRQRQISQSDCEISSNWGKNAFGQHALISEAVSQTSARANYWQLTSSQTDLVFDWPSNGKRKKM